MESATLVIKVNYGDTLRRFNVPVENGRLDLNMNGLKAKILSLFEISPDSDLTITYVDEDGDVVTLIEDEDLRDVMRQNLKFLRITIVLNDKKSGSSHAGWIGSSTPVRSPHQQRPLPNVKAAVAEALGSIPDPLRESFLKLFTDFISKDSSSSPAISDFVSMFVNMAQSFATTVIRPPAVGQTSGQDALPNLYFRDSLSKKGKEVDAGNGPAACATPVKIPIDLNTDASGKLNLAKETYKALLLKNAQVPVNDPVRLHQKSILPGTGNSCQKPAVKTLGSSSADAMKEDGTSGRSLLNRPDPAPGMPIASPPFGMWGLPGECPFSGATLPNQGGNFTGNSFLTNPYSHSEAVFHKGVRCDGCGVHPIAGPRFKSKVKEDFDLCSICFGTMGKVEDYVRLDRPVPYGVFQHGRPPVRGVYDPFLWPAPPALRQKLKGYRAKTGKPKLDSRFVTDVTVMDGTVMAPSTPFTKIWRMRNNGGFVWHHGTQLVWIGGDKFSDTVALELEIPTEGVQMDGELNVAIDFKAPNSPGHYVSYWSMASPSGQKFGQPVWVLIQVDASLDNSFCTALEDLNLNLPAQSQHLDGVFGETGNDVSNLLGNMNFSRGPVEAPIPVASLVGSSSSGMVTVPEMPETDERKRKEVEMNFPINSALLTREGEYHPSTESSSSISYPKIKPSVAPVFSFATLAALPTVPDAEPVPSAPSEAVTEKSSLEVEATLLKEMEEMGFKQVDLTKEILRMNASDLEQSVEALSSVSEWDPILEELHEMGFRDKEMNKDAAEEEQWERHASGYGPHHRGESLR